MADFEIKDGVGIIPEGTEYIYENAFEDCTELTRVVIPDSVTGIGEGAFHGCTGLTSIVIPDSVTEIERNAFEGCTGLTNIVIPDSVTEIGPLAFSCCPKLGSIIIPNSITEISDAVFFGCTGLTSIVIPDSVTKIGVYAFGNCFGLASVVIPSSVEEICCSAFDRCTGLTSIAIPDSVTEIGDCAFFGCTGLTSIVVSEGNKMYDSRDNSNAIIKTETNKLIAVCKNTVIPNSVAKIGTNSQKVIKGGKVEIIIQGRLGIVEYDDYGMEAFEDNYNVTFGWIDINSVMVGTDNVEDIESHQVKKAHFYELFRANGPHPLPVSIRGRDEDNVEASYIIELSDDEVFDINKVQLICPVDRPDELWELYNFVADHILYDEKEISTNLLDYSADNPGLEDEISYL